MEFIENAKILIPALTGLPFTVWNGTGDALTVFEERYCFSPAVQRIYTREGLEQFFARKDHEHIYVISDPLETHCVIQYIEDRWIILGPFVTEEWKHNSAAALLAKCGLQEADRLPYKLYRCELPVIPQAEAVHIAVLVLDNSLGNSPPQELEIIDLRDREPDHLYVNIAAQRETAATVNRRYALENQFIEAVAAGHTQQAIERLNEIQKTAPGLTFLTPSMKDQIAGGAIMRTLVRRAAVQAGLSPILIDSISQEYAQKMHKAVKEAELFDLLERCIVSMCLAIREHQQDDLTGYVHKAQQYIEVNLSQPISIDALCRYCGVSRKQFVRTFTQETGKTVKQYVSTARCERAAELLANSRLKVQDISAYVGYEDNNYFSKVFKSIYGVSPQEYRKQKSIL